MTSKPNTRQEILRLYRGRLQPQIAKLEVERKTIKAKIVILIFFTSLIVAGVLLKLYQLETVYQHRPPQGPIQLSVIILILTIIGAIIYYKQLTKNFRRVFKRQIIKEIFNILLPDCQLNPEQSVDRHNVIKSKLINPSFNGFKGEDYIKGKMGEIDLEFSELNLTKTTGSGKHKRTVTIFKGLFFACYSKQAGHEKRKPLIIRADLAERVFGSVIGRFWQKLAKFELHLENMQLVHLEDAQFEKNFVVYAEDQIEARVILNPMIMKRLQKFAQEFKHKFEVSFIDHQLFFIIHSNKNHFEPNIFSEVIRWKDVVEVYEIFELIKEMTELKKS